MLQRRFQSVADIVKVLQVYHDNIAEDEDVSMDGDEPTLSQKSILAGLLTFLESC